MDYRQSLAFLYGLAHGRGMKLGLDRVAEGARRWGAPHLAFPALHVAGTNGKGSVSAMAASVLRKAGHKVGLFTSPHLHRLTERIRVDGREISRKDLSRLASELAGILAGPGAPEVTFFEAMTLIALRRFAEACVDIAVVEVGLGGRLDATNIVSPLVTVITSIGYDHTDWLGPDLRSIAREKAGILKPGVPAVMGSIPREVEPYFQGRAKRLGCPSWWLGRDYDLSQTEDRAGPFSYQGPFTTLDRISVPLQGFHQQRNAAMAITALTALREQGVDLTDRNLRQGLQETVWPARFEAMQTQPQVILDAAHNPHGAEALALELRRLPKARTVLFFGVLIDKDVRSMLEHLRPLASKVILVEPPVGRGRDPRTYSIAGDTIASTVEDGLARAMRQSGPHGRVVVTGSIYLVAAARGILRPCERTDPPIDM